MSQLRGWQYQLQRAVGEVLLYVVETQRISMHLPCNLFCCWACRKYAAEIAHNVSAKKRREIVERAREVRLTACSQTVFCHWPGLQLHQCMLETCHPACSPPTVCKSVLA